MLNRQNKEFWLNKYCRLAIAFLGSIGFIITAYLTIAKLSQSSTICPTKGCEKVLSSPYAEINGIPLSLFGCLAYLSVIFLAIAPFFIQGRIQEKIKIQTHLFLLIITTMMSVMSGYLIYLLLFIIKAICLYCLVSALLSFSLFCLSLFLFSWGDIGELLFTLIVVGVISFVGILGWHSNVNLWSVSSTKKVALAQHLMQVGAKMYGAFWCGHCQQQKQLFGKEAFRYVNYIECDPQGENAQPNICQKAGVTGFPTWSINGELLIGVQSLDNLARVSNFAQVQLGLADRPST